MLLAWLVETSNRVAATRSRIAKVDALTSCLRRLSPGEIEIGVAYLSGETRRGRSGIGYALIRSALESAPAPTPQLSLAAVDAGLDAVAAVRGSGSTAGRARLMRELFGQATPDERDFLARLLLGELRQGALEGVMLDAIARAAEIPAEAVRAAAMRAGSVSAVARVALTEGAGGFSRFALQVFRPVTPMLAQPAADIADALEKLGRAAFEWKLDGVRVQAHKSGSEVRIYTRNLNDVTAAVPEVAERVRAAQAEKLILDGEAIALRPDGTPYPFQDTMRRFGRKLEVEAMRREIPLSVFFFDCLLADAGDLTPAATEARFGTLARVLPPDLVMPRLVTDQSDAAEGFLEGALAQGHEGVMAKALHAPYEAGNRGSSWLKIKQANTLDLVIVAAEWGNGRRQGWLSNLHLGARDPDTGRFVMLGKTFKGLTDAMLEWQTRELLAREVGRAGHVVQVRPEIVVEIAFNEIQASSQYPSGLALRFARVKRYRQDKTAAEADTVGTVRALFEGQLHRRGG